MILKERSLVDTFSYYQDGSTRNPVSYLYSHDLDNDRVDEVIAVAFETQPNTPAEYSNTSIHIFGWRDNHFQNLTDKWFPNKSNLVEGVGDVAFGDFNGDGFKDVFLSAYTDMDHAVNAYALYGQGGSFIKQSLGLQYWQHSARAFDINNDGFDDVVPTGYSTSPRYMGSSQGLQKYDGFTGGSGLALGDFLGNRTASVIFVDAGNGLNDTYLYKLNVDLPRGIWVELISLLPGPRLESRTPPISSHDIRVVPIDFNDDGRLDVVVVSYGFGLTNDATHKSELQFLKNEGNGLFEDVTDTWLRGYDNSGYPGYVPQLVDVNKDGLDDLFLSQPDWQVRYNSTTLLLRQPNYVFVDSFRDTFRKNIESGGGQGVVVQGPKNVNYLVTEGEWKSDSYSRLFIQEIYFPEREESENLVGTTASEEIYGLGGNDRISSLGGDDQIDGGNGIDTSVYRSSRSNYVVTKGASAFTVVDKTATDGNDTLTNVERLKFSDVSVAFDLDGNAGKVAKLLGAVFGKTALTNKEYVGIGLDLIDGGMGYQDLAALAVSVTKKTSSTDVCTLLWTNVFGKAPTTADIAPFKQMLDSGEISVGALTALAADTSFNTTNIDLVGLSQTGIEYV